MPSYPRPKSSIPKKSTRSSLHPHGAPGFTETVEGLKRNLSKLGMHLAGAAMGMAGNVTGALQKLKRSAEEGDENSEQAYQEALAMLRASGSSTADSLLRELGEQPGEKPAEGEEDSTGMRDSEDASPGRKATETAEAGERVLPEMQGSQRAGMDMTRVKEANEPVAGAPERDNAASETQVKGTIPPVIRPEDFIRGNKVVCLECGREFRQLTHMHLLTHGLTPEEYRRKYGFPLKMPLSARARTSHTV